MFSSSFLNHLNPKYLEWFSPSLIWNTPYRSVGVKGLKFKKKTCLKPQEMDSIKFFLKTYVCFLLAFLSSHKSELLISKYISKFLPLIVIIISCVNYTENIPVVTNDNLTEVTFQKPFYHYTIIGAPDSFLYIIKMFFSRRRSTHRVTY